MYTPQAFDINDPDKIRSFVKANGFGILISSNNGEIESTHTPMYLSQDMKHVFGHIAKANPQWKSWSASLAAKAIFQGPHAYVSPTDYLSSFNVPTWNYTAVSIDGPIELLPSVKEKRQFVEHLVWQYESIMESPWRLDTNDKKMMGLLDGIVCFRIQVRQIQAKFKINQNKSIEDQRHVVDRLRNRKGDMNTAIAELMEANLRQSEQTNDSSENG